MQNRTASLEAIVFDFDGTLVTLDIDFLRMRCAVLRHLSGYGIPVENLQNLYILEMIDAGRRLVTHHHPGDESRYVGEAMQLIQDIEVEAAAGGQLIEGTRNMLAELRKRRIKLGVVTRNCQAALERIFPDIYGLTDIVLTRNHINRVKPDPEHLRRALHHLCVHPGKAAMVGDHPMDIRLGLEVGTMAIGVLTGHSDRQKLLSSGAEMILDKAADMMALFP